ncbi:MAG TPA: twin-arginine translocase TatA/TatE family subunit [Solirubrobacteraceae bacterium]|nr:twin-arginine translocase TatA/TatE family subunit [Solirubrobacteraceae bacterium]
MVGDIMQPTHLLFVLVIALLVLGPKRLPEVGRQLGRGLRDFRAAINGEKPDHEDALDGGHHQNGAESELYQAPPQPVDRQFAHDSTEPAADQQFTHDSTEPAADQHQFAHDSTEPAADQHQFAHASSGPAENTHQSAHDNPAVAPALDADAGPGRPAGEHEFAYEPARPAEKPVDPLT